MGASDHILYEVVVAVAREAREDYLAWLRRHISDMLGLDGFLSADLYADAEDDCLFTCAYRLRDRAAMDAYIAGPAAAMRAEGIKRFGDRMSARRRVLQSMEI